MRLMEYMGMNGICNIGNVTHTHTLYNNNNDNNNNNNTNTIIYIS